MGLGRASSGTYENMQGMHVVDAGNSAQDVDVGPTTTAVTKNQHSKMKPRGAASKLFDKFSSDRQYDPFLDSDQVIQDSKAGMETLLSMCNPVEINSLYGALGFIEPCTRRAKEHQIMEIIRKGGREVQKKFSEVLRLFWEGLLYEYLRSVGCPLRGSEHDPRHFVLRYWQRSTLDPSVRQGFVPFYLKREVKQRSGIIEEDKDIRDIRAGLMACEKAVKETEQRVREQHDYRFVLQYFCASRELHRTLVANVNYLANEVENLRASVDHSDESIKLMEQQLLELETKYDRVVGGLVHRGAFHQTLEGTLYGMINDANAILRAAEITANEVLATMKVGPDDNNDGDVTLDSVNGDSPSPPLANDSREDGVEMPVAEQVDEPARLAAPQPERSTTPYHQSRGSPEQCVTSVRSAAQPGGCWIRRDSPLGCRLERVRETHRETCRRYDIVLANLETKNITLADALSEASTARDHFATQATQWEARHDALEKRLAEVERASKADIAEAIEHANQERERARKATYVLRGMLERSTPILLDMVSTFVPRDSEEFGVELLRALDVNPDIYAHIVATKRMFQADLESRALETATAERDRTTADMKNIEEEEKADSKNKRGRPGSRGKKESRSAMKGKGDSKSKSRPKPSKGGKVAANKEGRADRSGKARLAGRETPGSGQGGERYSPIKASGKRSDGTTWKGASESGRVIGQGLSRKGDQGKKKQ